MEICHFFVIFYDFVMKCVYKSTIYTFVIRDKRWTPPLCCTKVYMLLLCFGSRKHPPTPYMSGTFVLAPPHLTKKCSLYDCLDWYIVITVVNVMLFQYLLNVSSYVGKIKWPHPVAELVLVLSDPVFSREKFSTGSAQMG